MIEIKNLEKKYGKFVAIKDFNLKIEEGKTYGILARKNSGGTTIFKILCNYIFEDSGEVLIDGKTPENARDLIYLCPKMRFYEKYTMRKILNMISEYIPEGPINPVTEPVSAAHGSTVHPPANVPPFSILCQ